MNQANRPKIVAGNWKMNTTVQEGIALAEAIVSAKAQPTIQVLMAPPMTHLQAIGAILQEHPNYALAAQNVHPTLAGAFTGEVSVPMLKDLGVSHVIIGHSERRGLFLEKAEFIARKITAVLEAGLTPILCLGEPLSAREAQEQEAYVAAQLEAELHAIEAAQLSRMIVAYEPIWAIGTGKTASAEQAQTMHASIRKYLAEHFDALTANAVPILYGGSCKPNNAASLFAAADVDGGLIGGASLKAADFVEIIRHLEDS